MKILILTNLFPNHLQPDRGIFNKQQFLELKKHCDIHVVSPLPWYPKLPIKTKNSIYADIPKKSTIDEINVEHPRYLVVPKLSQLKAGTFMYLGIKKTVENLYQTFPFDVILSTWAYPDSYAAYLLSKQFKKKLFCKVHGSDINVLTKNVYRTNQIVEAFTYSQKIIAVTQDLKNKIASMGIAQNKIAVIANGVDLKKFYIIPKDKARKLLNLEENKKYILFVGHLTAIKGIEYLIQAMKRTSDKVNLLIIGEGPDKSKLESLTQELGLSSRIQLFGAKAHEELVVWFNAADIFCLPSLNEGCPNVIIEALACGKFIVASKVGGIPELVNHENLGILIEPKNPEALANALNKALSLQPNPEEIRKHALKFSWEQSALQLFNTINQN